MLPIGGPEMSWPVLDPMLESELGIVPQNAALTDMVLQDGYETLSTRAHGIASATLFCTLFAPLSLTGRNCSRMGKAMAAADRRIQAASVWGSGGVML
ncbi:hypothetical protein [Actinomadura miaoliensis]|uniref:Uncharacterized protein n=1 Tax=Actinomadura miaoliensis TaxID=430685 RepID=A0ABP7VR81_9ACTN